jgi:hypothetical protein
LSNIRVPDSYIRENNVDIIINVFNFFISIYSYKHKYVQIMDPKLPPGWQILRSPNGQVIYVNMSTGAFQDTPPVAAAPAALALPPGWTQMTNESGRTIYINQSLGRMQYEFPQAEAEQAQAPSAPPVDPRTEQVKTRYYPHVGAFSEQEMSREDIINMLYHPAEPPQNLTPDDIDLIINNYVGTDIPDRKMHCKEDPDILSCAKTLFNINARIAQEKYSFENPIQKASYYDCNVPFRENRDKPKDKQPTIASNWFPQNLNTVRWLLYSTPEQYPTLIDAETNMFFLDFYRGSDRGSLRRNPMTERNSYERSPMEIAIMNRDRMSTPQFREQQARDAVQAQEQQRKLAEEDRIRAEQQRILDLAAQQQTQANISAQLAMGRYGNDARSGGLKRKQSRRKRKQSRRKQSRRNRMQSRRKQSRRRS